MSPMSLLCIACRCHYYAERGKNSLIYAQLSTLAWSACALFDFRALSMTQFTLTLYFQSLTHSLTQVAIDPMALSLNLGANEGIRGFSPTPSLLSRFPSISAANPTTFCNFWSAAHQEFLFGYFTCYVT